MDLIDIAQLTPDHLHAIWALADAPGSARPGLPPHGAPPCRVAWSFEGHGIRTRTSFLQAFQALGLSAVELPGLLQTAERTCDLAGYLDPVYDLYVVRAANHQRLAEFAAASCRPVVNAMSSQGHPCEVLTDAYYIDRQVVPLARARIALWGPATNVLRSWHALAQVLQLSLTHICAQPLHEDLLHVQFASAPCGPVDVLITDGWPAGAEALGRSLTRADLEQLGQPVLLPTPPFAIGRELAFDPLDYPRFAGYGQKALLLPVQQAILRHLLAQQTGR